MGCGMSTHNGFEADAPPRPAKDDQQESCDLEHDGKESDEHGQTVGAAAVLSAATAIATGEPASLSCGALDASKRQSEDKSATLGGAQSEADETSRAADESATDTTTTKAAMTSAELEWKRFSSAEPPQLDLLDLSVGEPLVDSKEPAATTAAAAGVAVTEKAMTMTSTTTATTIGTSAAIGMPMAGLTLPELLPSIEIEPIELDAGALQSARP
ncbi:acid phosphatase [Purpureocillium lavendulum]|uniref:Acid phosphatase n=1 Tax=Purpureocillium lavendulum TaxID=1247861 RepID=A0AB34FUK6_9HYPO|nr:acid phosphatase [Purpureocillium lavendulum]